MNFKTSLKVSAPKEHSELMARVAEKIAEEKNFKYILDMGTGTGYIALFLQEKGFKTDGCDISFHAVKLAKGNCKGRNINMFQSNLFTNVKNRYDMILFNPPASGKGGESVLSNIIRKTFFRKFLAPIFYKISSRRRLSLIFNFLRNAQHFLNKNGVVLVYLNPKEIEIIKIHFKKIYDISIIKHKEMANSLKIIIGRLK